jgi:hypothetical protein
VSCPGRVRRAFNDVWGPLRPVTVETSHNWQISRSFLRGFAFYSIFCRINAKFHPNSLHFVQCFLLAREICSTAPIIQSAALSSRFQKIAVFLAPAPAPLTRTTSSTRDSTQLSTLESPRAFVGPSPSVRLLRALQESLPPGWTPPRVWHLQPSPTRFSAPPKRSLVQSDRRPNVPLPLRRPQGPLRGLVERSVFAVSRLVAHVRSKAPPASPAFLLPHSPHPPL